MTVLYVLVLVFVGFVAWLVLGIRQIGTVSQGAPVGERPGKALLLIDLQTVFWDTGPYTDDQKTAARSAILRAVETARAQGQPVIALRQEWSRPATRMVARLFMKGQALAGSPGIGIAAPFHGLADHVIVKRVQDGFETGALDALLDRLQVGQLQIAGLDLNYCVLKTALAARNRGFVVRIDTAATLAAAPADKAQDQLRAAGVALT
ncbi:isochorismatase [Actibacterium mucosum KCTC 23349]|uniref:Isochorismatase n=1 Tax=Actibacterium mucosum KCTC 23349 TaxID=1454373 RepID=A0A037ZKI7_9RHOB|nr:isochorismatase family cysteine hydrolase [Actibacterium mucosum]KAJ56623.1 isochorismatase [Actibacterium mucosum KCTC 23349]